VATTNNAQYATKSESLQLRVKKWWATHGHATMHYLQQLNESCNHHLLFIQSKHHTWCFKRGYKTLMCDGTINKTTPSGNNKQFALYH
jgi:hypothetical protein